MLKIAQNGHFWSFFDCFRLPRAMKNIFKSQNRLHCIGDKSGQLFEVKNCQSNVRQGRQWAPKCKILAFKSLTLILILKAFPNSNFKFRPIFWKFRGLSFTSVFTRSRHFDSFRAKNRLEKVHIPKIAKNVKNSKKIFLLKKVQNMSKHVSLNKFFDINQKWRSFRPANFWKT